MEKTKEEIEYECYECGREWTRNNGRGCPYGDPTCFLCEKHDHSDCDDPRQACDEYEHEWKKTDSYIGSFWDGYAVDAVEIEELVIEYTCEKCGIIKEE